MHPTVFGEFAGLGAAVLLATVFSLLGAVVVALLPLLVRPAAAEGMAGAAP